MAQQSCCYFRRRAGGFLCVTQANLEDFVGDAIATSTNRRLEGAHRRNWWGFAGRRSADAALHARAGAELLRLCHERASELRFGEVLATPAGPRLDAQHVLHTAVPSHPAGRDPRPLPASQAADFVEAPEAAELLRRSYAELLRTAAELGVQSLACPAIGCGCRGYPVREAAEVALRAVGEDAAVPYVELRFWDTATFSFASSGDLVCPANCGLFLCPTGCRRGFGVDSTRTRRGFDVDPTFDMKSTRIAARRDIQCPSEMQLQATFWAWRDRCPEVGLDPCGWDDVAGALWRGQALADWQAERLRARDAPGCRLS